MQKTSSKHYDFYYLKGSIAERDVNKIVSLQEKCYEDICNVLNIRPKIRIKYYLLDTPELVGEIYGDNEPCNGFACPPNKIYAVYNDKIKCVGYHEDVHILSYTINRPKSNFIREGLAMYFDKFWWDKTNEEWIRLYLKENKYVEVSKLLSNDIFFNYSDSVTYPIAGAFTKFLIDYYGIHKYILLYKYTGEDFIKRIEMIYGEKVEDIEKSFILSLLTRITNV